MSGETRYGTQAALTTFKIRAIAGAALVLVGVAVGIWADMALTSSTSDVSLFGAKVYFWALPPCGVGAVLLIGEWLLTAYDSFRGRRPG